MNDPINNKVRFYQSIQNLFVEVGGFFGVKYDGMSIEDAINRDMEGILSEDIPAREVESMAIEYVTSLIEGLSEMIPDGDVETKNKVNELNESIVKMRDELQKVIDNPVVIKETRVVENVLDINKLNSFNNRLDKLDRLINKPVEVPKNNKTDIHSEIQSLNLQIEINTIKTQVESLDILVKDIINDIKKLKPKKGEMIRAGYFSGEATGVVKTIVAGLNTSVDSTDPANPIINSLADRYKTTSNTSQAIVSTGSLTFTVEAGLAYIPQQDVIIVYDSSNHMHGTITSYSGTTMVVDITHKSGSGTYSSWVINLDGTPVASSVAWGTITGTLSDQTDLQTALNGKWGTRGNSGTNPTLDFIGTTDNQDVVFRRNNTQYYKLGINGTRKELFFENDTWLTFGRTDGYRHGMSGNTAGNLDIFGVHSINYNVHNGDHIFYGNHSTPVVRMTLKGNTGNLLLATTTDSGYKIDVNGTGIFRSTGTTTIPLTVRGFSGQTADLHQWQDSASTSLLSVSSGGTLKSYQATGAKDLLNHTRNDGMTVRLWTSNGYDARLEPNNGGQLHLGQPGGGGTSHITTLYGGETYYSHPFNSRNSLKIVGIVSGVGAGERYGASTDSDFEVQITNHSITGGAATHAYCSGSIFRGTTLRGNSAAQTITDASTVRIEQAPTASTNASITNAWALHVVAGASKFGGPIQLPGYTVATLPAGKTGYCAYVTDALVPVALANVVGGGAVTVKVFYDGTNWIVQ